MPATLSHVSHEHDERILGMVDQFPATADLIGHDTGSELNRRVQAIESFLSGTLVPHMEAAEEALYPQLERILEDSQAMSPMRREHSRLREEIVDFQRLTDRLRSHPPTIGEQVALRRMLFSLYALVKVHLAEESLYMRIVEHGVSGETSDAIAAALEHPVIA